MKVQQLLFPQSCNKTDYNFFQNKGQEDYGGKIISGFVWSGKWVIWNALKLPFQVNKGMTAETNSMVIWEYMCGQLLLGYYELSQRYRHVSQQNISLYEEIQSLLEQRVQLIESDECSLPSQEESNRLKVSRRKSSTSLTEEKPSTTPQREYCCAYKNCQRIYRTSSSLNLHIKKKHNGGTIKEREMYADALLNRQTMKHGQITLPPNFLEEYRRSTEYSKKYKM